MGFADPFRKQNHTHPNPTMKLVAATAAAMAAVSKAQEVAVPEEGVIMAEEPWYAFLEPYGLEVTEEKWSFNSKDPKIQIKSYNDGSKFIVKSPWYNEKYEQKVKDTAFEMKFKNDMPGLEVANKMEYKEAQFNKNEKVEDPNCTDANPKKCLIETPIGVQNKREFKGEHSNSNGKYKVWQDNKYVHDLAMKPTEIHYREGWDFENFPAQEGDMALGMTAEGDMADNGWGARGETRMDVNMAYKMYTDEATGETMDHWDSTAWSFSHTTDNYGEGEAVMAAEGSSAVRTMEMDMEANSAKMTVAYESSSNQGWRNEGINSQIWENTDMCQEMMMALFEGRYMDFMTGALERPCTWLSEVDGTNTGMNAETGEQESMDYNMGIALQMTSTMDFSILYKNSVEGVANWARLFSMSAALNAANETEMTVAFMGNDLMTINREKMMAHQMEVADAIHRAMFEMYKNWEFEQAEWAQMDWTNEEHLAQFFAATINWDYPMSKMAEMEQNMVKEFQAMECNFPHWEEMASNGLTFHETAQEAMYQKKSECLQDMAMAEQVDYMRLAKLTWFMYSPTDTWTNKEIMMALWGMDYAEQYDFVATHMDDGMLDIYVDDLMFMYAYVGQEMPQGFTISEEEEAAIGEAFKAAMPSTDQLREYAQMIRDFRAAGYTQMSWTAVDQGMNDVCNQHYEMFLAGHQSWANMHIGYINAHREMTQEWVGKYNQWINTPRAEVEAMFDAYYNRLEAMKQEPVYECEYQFWSAPAMMEAMFADQSEECQDLMEAKYEGIAEWGDAKKMEAWGMDMNMVEEAM